MSELPAIPRDLYPTILRFCDLRTQVTLATLCKDSPFKLSKITKYGEKLTEDILRRHTNLIWLKIIILIFNKIDELYLINIYLNVNQNSLRTVVN